MQIKFKINYNSNSKEICPNGYDSLLSTTYIWEPLPGMQRTFGSLCPK
jgi:hypothetical protein